MTSILKLLTLWIQGCLHYHHNIKATGKSKQTTTHNRSAHPIDHIFYKMATKDDLPKLIDKELDLSNAGRGVWLVKVPKYIANKWEKAPGNIDVGKLRISKTPGQKAQVSLSLSEAVMNLDPQEKIPKDHRLDVSVVTKQTLGVFSHLVCTSGKVHPSVRSP